ncbi:hypothetical protein GUJ93_ZPchr0012g19218 [Zizania palustris]|uniref:Uncharacterized protein n=1 Tax=Zizania palustris TaxID=103762 RepID=A0A8J6BX29_ZIZPA|nr:hypothetical protein GUJ93_ZPchr0012g19218 [Zizania palustris]
MSCAVGSSTNICCTIIKKHDIASVICQSGVSHRPPFRSLDVLDLSSGQNRSGKCLSSSAPSDQKSDVQYLAEEVNPNGHACAAIPGISLSWVTSGPI